MPGVVMAQLFAAASASGGDGVQAWTASGTGMVRSGGGMEARRVDKKGGMG